MPTAPDAPFVGLWVAWIGVDGLWEPHVEARSAGEAFFKTWADRTKQQLPRVILRKGQAPPTLFAPEPEGVLAVMQNAAG